MSETDHLLPDDFAAFRRGEGPCVHDPRRFRASRDRPRRQSRVLTNGKAGTVKRVWLDELHGLLISVRGTMESGCLNREICAEVGPSPERRQCWTR